MRKQNIVNRRSVLEAAGDYRIKATLGITGWLHLSVHSDGAVRHLDVGSRYPGGEEAPKGLAVRQLKSYASWVQTVENSYHIARYIMNSPQSESSEEFINTFSVL
jgi:hypothetical protein